VREAQDRDAPWRGHDHRAHRRSAPSRLSARAGDPSREAEPVLEIDEARDERHVRRPLVLPGRAVHDRGDGDRSIRRDPLPRELERSTVEAHRREGHTAGPATVAGLNPELARLEPAPEALDLRVDDRVGARREVDELVQGHGQCVSTSESPRGVAHWTTSAPGI